MGEGNGREEARGRRRVKEEREGEKYFSVSFFQTFPQIPLVHIISVSVTNANYL